MTTIFLSFLILFVIDTQLKEQISKHRAKRLALEPTYYSIYKDQDWLQSDDDYIASKNNEI